MKIKAKNLTKILAFILSVLMLVVSLPVSVFASVIDFSSDNMGVNSGNQTTHSEVVVLEEEKSLREENIKHFKLSDGTTKAVVYTEAVHYKDENGEWVDIDNALTLNGKEYSASNKSEIKFANKSGSNGLVSIKDGDYKIDFTPLDANKVSVVIENPQSNDSRKFEDISKLNNLVSKAIYADIYDGVDIEYILIGNSIKENIIVKEKQDSYTFSFELKLNKLSAELMDGAIILSDYDSKEQVYEIPVPYMFDANNVYSQNVEYSLVQESKWKYTLTVTADPEWINAESRAFPVTVDPSFGVSDDDIISVIVNENGQIQEQAFAYFIGNGLKAYIKLNTLPQFPRSAYIVSADVNMYYCCGNETSVYLKEILSAWNENSASNVVLSDNPIDYVKTKELWGGEDDNNPRYNWNITTLANLWYNGGTNYGFALEITEEEKQAYFANLDYGYESREPLISITYRDMKGAEPYWSFISQSAGNAGTGSINLATGNLLFEISTLTTTDSLFGFTPSIIYNSAIAGEQYEYPNAMIGYWGSYAAKGFKMNFHETLIRDSFVNANGDNETYYVWADSDGTEHYFIADENGVYRDEDGLQLTLTVDTENDVCTVTDSAHNERVFVWNLGAIEDKVEKTYYLSYIKDASGNKLKFLVDAQRKPQYVRVEPNGMSEINMLNMLYNSSSVIYAVWNTVTGDAILFRHSDTPNGDLSATGGEYLREVLYLKCDPSNTNWRSLQSFIGETDNETDEISVKAVMQYTYDENGYLIQAHDTLSDYKIQYTYASGQVTSVTEHGKNGTQGQTIGIYYGTGYTEVRSSGSNDIYGDSDDIINVYVFDNQGRAITAYSTNTARTEIYGATTGQYVSDNENAKNSIKTSAITGGSSANYLLNGTFETSNTELKYWNKGGKVLLGSTVGSGVEWENSKANIYALNEQTSSLYQTVSLMAGDYTLSLNINTFESSDLNVKLMVREKNSPITDAIVEILPMNEYYASGSDSFAIFSFTLTESSDYEIGIYLEGNSEFDGAKYISVDNVMLSKTTGAQYCDYLNNGSFETQYSVIEDGETKTDNLWEPESGNTSYVAVSPYAFGSSTLKISGEIDSKGRVSNTVYTASDSAISTWLQSTAEGGAGRTTEPMTFIVSGFGKATSALMSENSIFALRAEITVLNKTKDENGTLTYEQNVVPYDFSFNKATGEWQYISGSFVIDENIMIGEIKIVCEYSNNIGDAYFDNISLVYDKEGDVSQYDYYENGKLKYQKTGSNAAYYIYDSNGNIERQITNRAVIDYEYSNNILIKETYSIHSGILVCEATSKDALLTALGAIRAQYVTTYEYDNYGLLIETETKVSETDTQRIISTNTYYTNSGSKIFGALKTSTDSLGNLTTYFYNANNGRLIAIIEDDETGMYYTYDDIGNLVLVQPATVDSNGNPVATQNTTDVEYVYDENTNELEHIVANGTTYTFTYDAFGNSQSASIGNTEIAIQVLNDNNGKIAYVEYANGTVVAYKYDKLGRTSEIKYFTKQEFEQGENGEPYSIYTYEYDSNGNLSKFTDLSNHTASLYFYDYTGKLVKTIDYDTNTNTVKSSNKYYYDDKSRLQNVFYYQDYLYNSTSYDQLMQFYHYTYNDDDSLKALSIDIEENDFSIDYTYDSLKRLTQRSYAAIVSGANNLVINEQYAFKTNGTRESLLVSDYIVTVGTNQTTFKYTYDENDQNITEIKNASNVLLYKYTYDSLDRLIREDNSVLGKTYIFEYDDNGNILSEKVYSYTTGNVSNLTPISAKTYEYTNAEWKDQLTSYNGNAITYDKMGNPLTYWDGTAFTWENVNNLISLEKPALSNSYTYNDEGIRTSKTVNGIKHEYTLEGTKILSEKIYNINGNEIALVVYLYDEANAPIGFMYRDSSDAKAEFEEYLFVKNIQGDIIGIYNTTGVEVVHYDYNAWGETVNITFEAGYNHIVQINPFRYRGYYFDSESGFYYLNSRYYDPQVKRFISADSIGVIGATPDSLTDKNLYAYCDNNPIMRVDDGGEFWNIVIGAAIGAVVGAVVSAVSQLVDDSQSIKTGEFWAHVGVSAAVGLISGGLAASGACLAGQVVANAVLGAVGSIADTAIDDDGTTSVGTYLINATEGAVMGSISGMIGGPGSASKHVTNSFKRVLKTKNFSYYFSQVGKQARRDGVKAISSIIKAATPTITKTSIKAIVKYSGC